MKLNVFAPALLLTIVFQLSPVAASLVDWNDSTLPSYQSADGFNITTDTLTNLDWLDIDTTTNISFDEMSALIGVGELQGFRYATLSEIDTFFTHLGLPTAPLPGSLSTPDPNGTLFRDAASHTGAALNGGNLSISGWHSVSARPDSAPLLVIVLHPVSFQETSTYAKITDFPPSSPSPTFGNWIVRPAQSPDGVIPEPSSVVLWGLLGALGLAVPGWRRRVGSQP